MQRGAEITRRPRFVIPRLRSSAWYPRRQRDCGQLYILATPPQDKAFPVKRVLNREFDARSKQCLEKSQSNAIRPQLFLGPISYAGSFVDKCEQDLHDAARPKLWTETTIFATKYAI